MQNNRPDPRAEAADEREEIEMKRVKGDTTTITMSVVFHDGRPAHRSNQIDEAQYRTCLNHCARCDAWFWPLPTPLPPEAPDPREALIDELARELRKLSKMSHIVHHRQCEGLPILRDHWAELHIRATDADIALAHAKAHQEDRQ